MLTITNFRGQRTLLMEDYTHLTNMLIPVGSIARLIAFHDATIVHFWRALSGSRSSVAAGAGGSLRLLSTPFLSPLLANLPNSHPMIMSLFTHTYTDSLNDKSLLKSLLQLSYFAHNWLLLLLLFSLTYPRPSSTFTQFSDYEFLLHTFA